MKKIVVYSSFINVHFKRNAGWGICLLITIMSLFSYSCRKDIKAIEDYYTYIDIHDYARDSMNLTFNDTIAGGIYLKIDLAGGGAYPKKHEKIYLFYKGRLLTGQQFDARDKFKFDDKGDTIKDDKGNKYQKPFSFMFRSDYPSIIAGWDSAFAKIPRGSKATILIPQELAYGNVSQSKIPPKSPLRFDIELLWLVGDPDPILKSKEDNDNNSGPNIEISQILGLIK
jgi:hypothetical protein